MAILRLLPTYFHLMTENKGNKQVHGLLAKESWPNPKCVVKSEKPNRMDQGNTTESSEYLDEPEVLEEKIEILADLIKKSKHVCAYTGAGLSRAAGISDYASSKKESLLKDVEEVDYLDARPTYSHYLLTTMEQQDLLHSYVQQNHDGLPQKAGFPQEKINEIHGAWFDPSNPVIKFNGTLRSDLYHWMGNILTKVDLCLCLGTSLSGMNADQIATVPARDYKKNKGSGTVMINLQKTFLDPDCTIRIWAKIDDAFKILAQKLGIEMKEFISYPILKNDIYYIPYNEKGKFVKDAKKLMKLDLTVGSKVKIINPDSSLYGYVGKVIERLDDRFILLIGGNTSKKEEEQPIGTWMIDYALRGKATQFPYSNENPEFIDIDKVNMEENKSIKHIISDKEAFAKEILTERKSKSFVIGNSFNMIDEETFQWKVYVKSEFDDIIFVKFGLHPSYAPTEEKRKKKPFEVERIGEGACAVAVHIKFKDGDEIKEKHIVSLKDNGSENSFKIEI